MSSVVRQTVRLLDTSANPDVEEGWMSLSIFFADFHPMKVCENLLTMELKVVKKEMGPLWNKLAYRLYKHIRNVFYFL